MQLDLDDTSVRTHKRFLCSTVNVERRARTLDLVWREFGSGRALLHLSLPAVTAAWLVNAFKGNAFAPPEVRLGRWRVSVQGNGEPGRVWFGYQDGNREVPCGAFEFRHDAQRLTVRLEDFSEPSPGWGLEPPRRILFRVSQETTPGPHVPGDYWVRQGRWPVSGTVSGQPFEGYAVAWRKRFRVYDKDTKLRATLDLADSDRKVLLAQVMEELANGSLVPCAPDQLLWAALYGATRQTLFVDQIEDGVRFACPPSGWSESNPADFWLRRIGDRLALRSGNGPQEVILPDTGVGWA